MLIVATALAWAAYMATTWAMTRSGPVVMESEHLCDRLVVSLASDVAKACGSEQSCRDNWLENELKVRMPDSKGYTDTHRAMAKFELQP